MPFSFFADRDNNLLRITVTGMPSPEEGLVTARDLYEDKSTPNVLWDFRKASTARISPDQYKEIIEFIDEYAEKWAGSKTALVGSEYLEHEMSKMLKMFNIKKLPLKFAIFRTIEEAMEWFDEKDNHNSKPDLLNMPT